ncbi:MAG: hypothetical protein ACI8UO_004303 [Verrucomicrobiales bacterium]|jgi:hypothetical protein
MKSKPKLTFMLSLLALFAASAQAQKLLPPTYEIGKEYIFVMDQDMVMDMTTLGAAVGQPMGKMVVKMKMEMSATCVAGAEAGQKKVTSKATHVQMDMNGGGIEMSFDSDEEGSENTMLGQQLGPIMQMDFAMILDKDDKVVEVEGLEDLQGAAGGQLFTPEQFKDMVNPAMRLGIPPAGVAIGEEWESNFDMDLGAQVGKMKMEFDVKYVRDEEVDGKQCAVLEFTADMEMDIKAGAAGAPQVQMKLGESETKGDMKIDKNLRFFRNGAIDMNMNMQMTNPLNPEQSLKLPMEMKQTFTLKEVKDL